MALSHSANNSSVLVLTYNFLSAESCYINKSRDYQVSPFVEQPKMKLPLVKSALLPFSLHAVVLVFDFLSQAWLLVV
jgi:hypothetical protein